jgi:L-rhamnose isomerase
MVSDLPNATIDTVNSWVKRNRIAPEHYADIVAAAKKRRLGVTLEMLVESRSYGKGGQPAHPLQAKPLISQPDGEAAV